MASEFDSVAHSGTLVYVGLMKAEITFQDPEFHKRKLTLTGSRNATMEDSQRVFKRFNRKSLMSVRSLRTRLRLIM